MPRKSVKSLSRIYGNQEDKDTIIAVLLKRMCTTDEIIEYLLSAIPEITKDDIIGELESQYSKSRTR